MTASGDPDPPPPEQLARAAREGCSVSFAGLVEHYSGPLHRFLRLYTGNAGDAEEVTQMALVRAWQKLPLYDPERPFGPWLFTLARRVAAGHLRGAGRRRGQQAPLPDTADPRPGPCEATSEREAAHNLWDLAIRVLPEDQRLALWLRYVEELPPEEIGRILGRRPGTVRVLLHRARRTLGRHLRPDVVTLPDLLPEGAG